MHWLNSKNKQSSQDNPIILKEFVNEKYTILYDGNLLTETLVEIIEGTPFCKYCNLDDCAHVGFAIYLKQMYGRDSLVIEDIN